MSEKKLLLYYTGVDFDSTQNDIPCYSFDSKEALLGYILSETSNDVVFLGIVNEDKFQISDDISDIAYLIDRLCDKYGNDAKIHLTQHESYEDAFKLALDYMEIKPNCYDK